MGLAIPTKLDAQLVRALDGLVAQGLPIDPCLDKALDDLVIRLPRVFLQLVQALLHLGLELDGGGGI